MASRKATRLKHRGLLYRAVFGPTVSERNKALIQIARERSEDGGWLLEMAVWQNVGDDSPAHPGRPKKPEAGAAGERGYKERPNLFLGD